MDNRQDLVDEAIEKIGAQGEEAEKLKEKLKQITEDIYENGKAPYEAMGMNKDMVEGLYSFGYRMYNTGKYDEAIQLFRLLIMLDPTNPKFVLGLAACFHMKKDYENAASSYVLCSMIDMTDPIPSYHASDCYINLGKNDLAADALKLCLQRIGNRGEFDAIKDRAQITLDMLEEKQTQSKKKENAA